jgi:hypothetical protein
MPLFGLFRVSPLAAGGDTGVNALGAPFNQSADNLNDYTTLFFLVCRSVFLDGGGGTGRHRRRYFLKRKGRHRVSPHR